MENILTAEGIEVFKIQPLKRNLPYGKDTEPGKAGETYSRYTYRGIVFTANDNSDFAKFRENNSLQMVDFKKGERITEDKDGNEVVVPSLEIVAVLTKDQVMSSFGFDLEKKRLTAKVLDIQMTDAELADLLKN